MVGPDGIEATQKWQAAETAQDSGAEIKLFDSGLIPRLVLCMKEDQQRLLSLLGQLPLRLTADQAGWVLNCQPHDIPALIHARMLKPLGNPSANGTKYFATADLLEVAKDRSWLFERHLRHPNLNRKPTRFGIL